MSCEPSCPDCGAVDCDRAQSSNQKCSSSFHPGFQKVCDACCRMECICKRTHPDWITCPICQCDLSGVCFDGEVPVWLDCGYCSKQCHEKSK